MSDESRREILYFCYGSNLLTSRMKISNGDAIKSGIGRLDDWQLVFSGKSNLWRGCPANIVPAVGDHVIGVIWSIFDVKPLDAQEVYYRPVEVSIRRMDSNEVVTCRSYVQESAVVSQVPHGIPSLAYKNVILAGARESSFPEEYIRRIQSLADNGIIPDAVVHLVPECCTGWPIPCADNGKKEE